MTIEGGAGGAGGGESSGGSGGGSSGESSGSSGSGSSSSSSGGGRSPGGVGEARQVVPPNTGDDGESHDEGDEGDDEGEGREKRAAKKTEGQRFKVKRGGKELELTLEDAQRMLDDEFEDEFLGPGGKPLKLNRAQLARAVQLHHGAEAKMRKLAEDRRRYDEGREWAKKNTGAYLESELGIEDHEQWALEIAAKRYQRELELTKLADENPTEYHKRIEQQALDRLNRKTALEKHRAEAEAARRDGETKRQTSQREAAEALKEYKLAYNPVTVAIARDILREHAEADATDMLNHREVARLTRERYDKMITSHLDGLDGAALLKLLGDGRRAKLRELEVEAAKGKKRDERKGNAPAPSGGSNGSQPKQKGMSEREFNKKYGNPEM